MDLDRRVSSTAEAISLLDFRGRAVPVVERLLVEGSVLSVLLEEEDCLFLCLAEERMMDRMF